MIVPLVIAFMSCLFGTIVIFRIVAAVESVHIARATAGDPRNDADLRRSAQEELLRKRKQAP